MVFQAEGGAKATVACTLTTKCVPESVPLLLINYQAQQAEIGSGAIYYEASRITPAVTGCSVVGYHVGSSSDHTATPTGLNQIVATTSTTFRIYPLDAAAKQTYQFYLWIELPDAAFSSVGPIDLAVGCTNYIDATLLQDMAALTQLEIGSQGTPNKLRFTVDDTNLNSGGVYKLNLIGFGSTRPGDCPPEIATYTLSTADDDSTLAVAEASVLPYSPGDSNFEITLSTTALGTYTFFVWGKDSETRWDNVGVSAELTVEVVCGGEVISTSSSSHSEVFPLNDPLPSLDFQARIKPLFLTSKAPCPITSFEFFSDASLDTPWSDSLMTLAGSNLAFFGTIAVSLPNKARVFVKGVSGTGAAASLPVDIIVCGNEVLAEATLDPVLMLADATGTASTFEILNNAQISSLFTIDASSNSHEDCLFGRLELSVDQTCGSPYSGTTLAVIQNPPQLKLQTSDPTTSSSAYLCLVSKGNKVASKLVQFEVCGGEIAENTRASDSPIVNEYTLGSGQLNKQVIPFNYYNQTLRTNSDHCQLASYSLVTLDDDGVASPYQGSVEVLLLPSLDIEVSTERAGSASFAVMGTTTSGSSEFLRFEINIIMSLTSEVLEMINTPPRFSSNPEDIEVTLKEDEPSEVEVKLPKVEDAHSNFCGVYIQGGGLQPFFASNSSNVTEWLGTKAEAEQQVFSYEFSSNTLKIKLPPSAPEQLLRTIELQITLIDLYKASSTSALKLEVKPDSGSTTDIQDQSDGDQEESLSEGASSSSNDEINQASSSVQLHQLTASIIKQLTCFGELSIEFSEPVRTATGDLEQIDDSVLDLQVQINQELLADDQSSVPPSFTWKPERISDRLLEIQVDWSEPSKLSPRVELDSLVVKVIKEDFFKSKSSEAILNPNSRTMTTKIPRQLKKTALTSGVDNTAQAANAVMKGATWTALVLNSVLSGLLNMMLSMINSLQLIVHLPIVNVAFPPNAFMVFESLIPIVTFDLLESFEDQVNTVLSWVSSDQEDEGEADEEVPQQFQNLGLESYQPAPNLGTLGVVVLFYLFKLVIYGLTSSITQFSGRGRELNATLKAQLFFSEILLIIIEGYLDFCLAALLFLQAPGGGMNWAVVGFIFLLAFGVVPTTLVWIGTLPSSLFKEEEFRSKWGVLFEDIRTEQVSQRLFFLAFIIRRVVYVSTAFLLINHPGLQLICLNLSNLGILIYQGYCKPIQSRLRNFIEATNESLMCMTTLHLMAFTDSVPDSQACLSFGGSLTCVVGLQITFNFGMILTQFSGKLGIRVRFIFRQFQALLLGRYSTLKTQGRGPLQEAIPAQSPLSSSEEELSLDQDPKSSEQQLPEQGVQECPLPSPVVHLIDLKPSLARSPCQKLIIKDSSDLLQNKNKKKPAKLRKKKVRVKAAAPPPRQIPRPNLEASQQKLPILPEDLSFGN